MVITMADRAAYNRGYLAALREVEKRLSGSAAFNCGSYNGFEYPAELVAAMIAERKPTGPSRGRA